jgi:hypothetical protein
VKGETTRSPSLRVLTALPTSVIRPVNSWPMMKPVSEAWWPRKTWSSLEYWLGIRHGTLFWFIYLPQSAVYSTLTMISPSSWILGTGPVKSRVSSWYTHFSQKIQTRTILNHNLVRPLEHDSLHSLRHDCSDDMLCTSFSKSQSYC